MQIFDHYMHLSFPVHVVFMTVAESGRGLHLLKCFTEISVSLGSCWRRQLHSEHREMISSLFIRPRQIPREALLLVQNLSRRICSHRRTICRWAHTGWSSICSRKTPMPATMQGGCWLSGWKNTLHLVPRACRGYVCIPKCRSRKNPPTSMRHRSVHFWRKCYRPIGITR